MQTMQKEDEIKRAIEKMKSCGVVGLNGLYMITKDVTGEDWIAPMSLLDKMLYDAGGMNINSFVKLKDIAEGN